MGGGRAKAKRDDGPSGDGLAGVPAPVDPRPTGPDVEGAAPAGAPDGEFVRVDLDEQQGQGSREG